MKHKQTPPCAATRDYLAQNIRPAMAQIKAQLRDIVSALEFWLSAHGLAGAQKRQHKGARS